MSFRSVVGVFGEVFLTFILCRLYNVKAVWCGYGSLDVIVFEPDGVLFKRASLIEVKTRDMKERWPSTPPSRGTILKMQSKNVNYDKFIAFIPYFINKKEGLQIAIYLITVSIIDINDLSWFRQSRFKGEYQLSIAKIIMEVKG